MRWQPANGEAAFKSAFDVLTPGERQMLRLHPKKGSKASQQQAPQPLTPQGSHRGICARVVADTSKRNLQVSAIYYLVFTPLANNTYGVWALFSFFF